MGIACFCVMCRRAAVMMRGRAVVTIRGRRTQAFAPWRVPRRLSSAWMLFSIVRFI